MADFFYDFIRGIGQPIVRITSRVTVLHKDRVPRRGSFILAANHLSPFDVALLIAITPRRLDFLSVVELQRKPLAGRFFQRMNVTFVDRSRPDTRGTMSLVKKLKTGRVVAMFPEGQIRSAEQSVISGGQFKPGIIKLAAASGAPILPCVVLGATGYRSPLTWLPLAMVRAAINFGRPLHVSPRNEDSAKAQLASAFVELAKEIQSRNTNPITP